MIKTKQDPKIVIALDYANPQDALNFVGLLDPTLCRLKVGKELFTAAGPHLVEAFVDLPTIAKRYWMWRDL